jgi:hypothetical protein
MDTFAWQFPNEMVFSLKSKNSRDNKGRAVVSSVPQQPFLATIVQWYTEFIGSKHSTKTTVYSSLYQSFCNADVSSVNAKSYTSENGKNAINQK